MPREKIRVLWTVDSLAPKAGTEQQMLELGRRIDTSRFELRLATFEQHEPEHVTAVFPAPHYFPAGNIWSPNGAWQILRMASFLRSWKPQIVHCFMVKSGLAGVVAGQLAGVPVVLTSRRDLGYYYTPRWLKTVRVLNRGVTRIVANSEAARRVAAEAEGFDASRIDVLYNGVDLAKFRPRQEVPPDAPQPGAPVLPADATHVVGIVANYRQVKDLPLFVRAAAHVARQLPKAVFLMIGKGDLQPELEALAASCGIRDRVVFTAGTGSVPVWLRQMSLGCLTSFSEGFSNSVLEYMAAGLPVVAMDVGGLGEAVEHGKTGLLVAQREPEAFGAAIVRVLSDPALAQRMGAEALRVCRTRFGLDTAIQNLEQYYVGLTNR